jgi:hypothetical protein
LLDAQLLRVLLWRRVYEAVEPANSRLRCLGLCAFGHFIMASHQMPWVRWVQDAYALRSKRGSLHPIAVSDDRLQYRLFIHIHIALPAPAGTERKPKERPSPLALDFVPQVRRLYRCCSLTKPKNSDKDSIKMSGEPSIRRTEAKAYFGGFAVLREGGGSCAAR